MDRLKVYSKLFDRRMSLFKVLIKTFSSPIIEIKKEEKEIINNNFLFNEDDYDII